MRRFIPEGFAAGTRIFPGYEKDVLGAERSTLSSLCHGDAKNITGKMSRLMANIWIFELCK